MALTGYTHASIPPPAPVPPTDDRGLPSPPTDTEKYSYLGSQHRWLLVLQALSFSLIAWSVLRFSTADVRLLLFLAPMTLYGVTLVVSLASGTRRRRVSRDGHRALVQGWAPATVPTVDVFLPTAGEPLDVLANTYRHVAGLEWAAETTVWVLDDAARPEVERLAVAHGFTYRTRPDRGVLKKAGNLRFGYEQSHGDLILILDADFVPRPDMLTELAPYFDEPGVGIVQSPQYFETRSHSMGWLQRCAGATQELFYRFIQPSRDRVSAAICVGTCAVYRRAALQAAGGFAQIGHSEDVHTGVKLMKAGYALRYVPVVVSKGLCPDQLAAFLNQQYRWCTGSMSLLADRSFHESPHVTRSQRLCFWAGFLYYISTAVNSVVAPLPALAMLWLLPMWVEPMNSVWLLGAVLLWFVVLPSVMKGRWRVDVLRLQYLYSFAHLTAIAHVVTGRTRGWVATGATAGAATPSTAARPTTPLALTITRGFKTYVALTQVALWGGLAHGAWVHGLSAYWAMILFALLASYIQLPLLFLRTGLSRPPRPVRVPRHLRRVLDRAMAADGVARPARRPGGRPGASPARPTAGVAAGARRFRPDIQGLRALAVLLVVLYHAEVPGVRAGYVGVDVFFVISGFLITGQLVRQVEQHGRIDLLHFYGGRVRRLLPPAVVVVLATVVAARLWVSVFRVQDVSSDALLTLVYGINYRLAALGVDYQDANGPVSPLQHMWSLAVEEQFYVVWPLLVALCAVLARALGRRRVGPLVTGVLVVLVGASLGASTILTSGNPPYSYFGIHTRAWELGAGALVAMAAPRLVRIPRRLAAPLSWAGLAAVVASAFVFSDHTAFPGTAALLPVLGAVAVVVAGCGPLGSSVERLLALRPLQGIGKMSYGWYLWHWPMIVLVPLAVGRELSWVVLVEVSTLALWFAVLTHYLVEDPALRSRLHPRTWLGAGVLGSGTTACLAVGVVLTLPSFVGTGAAAARIDLDRADTAAVQQALIGGLGLTASPRNLRPSVEQATQDQPASTKDGCHLDFLQTVQGPCTYGDPGGTRTMVLLGDSHAQQWLPALDLEAQQLGWRVVSWTKAACSVADLPVFSDVLGREFTECESWREATFARIARLHPDLVVVSQSDAVPGRTSTSTWADATARRMAELRGMGLPVVYVLDTPMPDQDVVECVATNLDDVGACNTPVADSRPFAGRVEAVAAALGEIGITTVDPEPWLCTQAQCPAIVGDVLVYRDDSHITATYSAWLAPLTAPLFTQPAPT